MASGDNRAGGGTGRFALLLAAVVGLACQPGELILPGEGTAGVSIGADAGRVVATLGEPERTVSHGVAGQDRTVSEYYLYPSRGLDVLLQNGRVRTIFLYNEGAEDHRRFEGRTPEGVHLGSTRREVVKLMGEPDRRGEGDLADLLFEYDQGIDFVFRPDATIHNLVIKPPTP